MQVEVIINSASALKNVNWRFGMLNPYAVVWIDTSHKYSTNIDTNNGMNPVWNEKFTIPLPPTSFPETAVLYIDIVHANAPVGTKPLVGSARLPLSQAITEARAHGKVALCLNLTRPSGRPQGVLGIKIGVKDPNIGQLNQYNPQPQPTPYKQQMAAQPLHQVQMQPQAQVQLQGQFQPRPQLQSQGQYLPQQPPQGQFQPQPQIQLQGQYLSEPQPQVQPRQVVQPQGQYQPRPVVQRQIQYQHQPQVQPQGPKLQQQVQVPQVQPMKKQPNNKLQQQVPVPQVQPMKSYPNNKLQQVPVRQVQPTKKNPNKPAPVNTSNSKGPVKPAPVQGPAKPMPAAANRPTSFPVNPVQMQQQYNPAFGLGPRENGTGRSRAMPIAQNQYLQSANNANGNNAISNNVAPEAAGPNDNRQTNSDPSADNTVDSYNAEQFDQTNSAETFNDAESIQLSYDESQCISVGTDNGGYDFCEYATTEEYDTGANANAGVEGNNGSYPANANVESNNGGCNPDASVGYDNGEYNADAGVEYDNGGYDANAGDNGGYDVNAGDNGGCEVNVGADCGYGGYDANVDMGYDNGVYDNGNYGNGEFDGTGLDNYIDCGEVDASDEY